MRPHKPNNTLSNTRLTYTCALDTTNNFNAVEPEELGEDESESPDCNGDKETGYLGALFVSSDW